MKPSGQSAVEQFLDALEIAFEPLESTGQVEFAAEMA